MLDDGTTRISEGGNPDVSWLSVRNGRAFPGIRIHVFYKFISTQMHLDIVWS